MTWSIYDWILLRAFSLSWSLAQTEISSMYITAVSESSSEISLRNSRNRIGASTDPCGTHCRRVRLFPSTLRYRTWPCLFLRKLAIHLMILIGIICLFIVQSSLSLHTLSYGWEKSKCAKTVLSSFFRSKLSFMHWQNLYDVAFAPSFLPPAALELRKDLLINEEHHTAVQHLFHQYREQSTSLKLVLMSRSNCCLALGPRAVRNAGGISSGPGAPFFMFYRLFQLSHTEVNYAFTVYVGRSEHVWPNLLITRSLLVKLSLLAFT